ncbi:hypothetical protein M0802_015356 [Mischocyttarus mexicanus]|nr:hypothetical protein M0802_015356 [Mischocyttarus mexicanus]
MSVWVPVVSDETPNFAFDYKDNIIENHCRSLTDRAIKSRAKQWTEVKQLRISTVLNKNSRTIGSSIAQEVKMVRIEKIKEEEEDLDDLKKVGNSGLRIVRMAGFAEQVAQRYLNSFLVLIILLEFTTQSLLFPIYSRLDE